MVAFMDLWLAILLSAVGVFIVSSLIHMVIGWHKGDYGKLPGEAEIMKAMREHGVNPGQYMFPCAGSFKEAQTPEMMAKFEEGPIGFLSVIPSGAPRMGKNLVLWFGYSVLVSVFVAYIATLSLPAGAAYGDVFRITATVAFLGYAVNNLVDSIWKGVRWGITLRFVADGVLYGLFTAGVFGWQWPAAA